MQRNFNFLPVVNRFLRNLIEYVAQGTSLKTIGRENFKGMQWLERLNLFSNLIETVQNDAFQGLSRLNDIDLSMKIENLP